MAPKLMSLEGRILVLAALALPINAAKILTDSIGADKAFADTSLVSRISSSYHAEVERMLLERQQSEAVLNRSFSVEGACKILQEAHPANATSLALIEETLRAGSALQAPRLRAHPSKSLVEEKFNPSSGLQKANKVLGEMITQADMEYDQLHLECSAFFKKQCTLMETCREDISSANSLAANWRSKVLSAQSEINICEVRLPRLKFDLSTNIRQCNTRLGYLRRDLAVVLNDVAVMEEVIKLTQCTGNFFMQMEGASLCECRQHNQSTFTTVGHEALHSRLMSLKSQHARQLVQEGLAELSEDQTEGAGDQGAEAEIAEGEEVVTQTAAPIPLNATNPPNVTITKFENPPLPQAKLPSDPCKGISYDSGEGGGGCVLRKSPACFNLQNKFLTIQGETVDKRDELLEEIKNLEAACKETKETLEAEIETFTTKQADEHTKLASATSSENEAGEEGQTKAAEHTQLKSAMLSTRTTCSTKFRSLESELCALKKIRGELNKMKGATHPFFQDCEVADKWEEKDCSASCSGGVQELTRAIVTPPANGGAECPPTKQMQKCNEQPCPIDCKMSQWSGFSACSADCGGGVSERTRNIKVQPRYEGDPCGETTETLPCNMQACDKDCALAKWTAWSPCSKACDGGRMTRIRKVKTAAVGRGKCPKVDSKERLERKKCNEDACVRDATRPLMCQSKIDLVLLLDGSGSVGSTGWAATKVFAKKLVTAFSGPTADTQVAVILFSGPYSYRYMRMCAGSGGSGLSMENDCKVKMVQHYSSDMAATTSAIDGLSWPRGTTLTSQALELALSEITLGRADAEKVVLTITDGIPMSSRSTSMSAGRVKKKARLMFGAVRLSGRGLRYMISWGSRPTSENVLKIRNFQDLESLDTIDTLVVDMCKNITMPTTAPETATAAVTTR